MGYVDEWGEWHDEEAYAPPKKPTLWLDSVYTPVITSKHVKQAQASMSPGTPKGRSKGGKARAKSLSPERRKEIAQLAARARWKS